MNKKIHKVAVACRNANGDADLVIISTQVTDNEYDLGVHYDLAESEAESQGYEGPFLCYDEFEQRNIRRVYNELANI